MNRSNLKLVASQSSESLMAHRISDVHAAWYALMAAPYVPQFWFAWCAASDRLESERLRYSRRS